MNKAYPLTIALRAHTVHIARQAKKKTRPSRARQDMRHPRLALVIDTETTTDISQRLKFGFYRIYEAERLLREGIFHADDLSKDEVEVLAKYCRAHREQDATDGEPLQMLPLDQFKKDVFKPFAIDGQAAVIGFNLPFDLSRIALGWGRSRSGATKGGFSLLMHRYWDKDGRRKGDKFFPRIGIKSIDSKRAISQFTSKWRNRYRSNQGHRSVPAFRGMFIDCRTLAYALTGEAYSLRGACQRFRVLHPKMEAGEHGMVTGAYLDYARRDVLATWDLSQKLLEEFNRHPIGLPPNRAYSPASIGKAYLDVMGIQPPGLIADKNVHSSGAKVEGYAMNAYYGGRAECRIRRTVVPVVYLDFVSMYPTVNSLMGLWVFLTSDEIETFDATQEVNSLFARMRPEDLFNAAAWRSLAALVQILPEADLLPVRAGYSRTGNGQCSIGLNLLTSKTPVWYTLADCIASKLHTGKSPQVIRAIGFRPKGKQRDLRPVKFGGSVYLDPVADDFFRKVVESRYAVRHNESLTSDERERLQHGLKILANSTSYGIFIELNRQDSPGTFVRVFGADMYKSKTNHPEEPGRFYFPILGSLITGAARLMLTLAELEVSSRGGTFAFMDTDSIAVVASENGELIPCPGGIAGTSAGGSVIKALSWRDVDEICSKFARLNPYDTRIIRGGILRMEDENFVPTEGADRKREQLYCLAVSSKRYALFNTNASEPVMRKCSEHGLGCYVPPVDPKTGAPVSDWVDQVWARNIWRALGQEGQPEPRWAGQLARTQISISTPGMLDWFKLFNLKNPSTVGGPEKDYRDMVKPFGFLEHVPLDPIAGRPPGVPRTAPFCLVRPIGTAHVKTGNWVNIHDPSSGFYEVVTGRGVSAGPRTCVGRTYGDIILEHAWRPESKYLGPDGEPCGRQTMGLLGPRRIEASGVVHIGKEANELDLVEAGLIDDEERVLSTYKRDLWEEILPLVARVPAKAIQEALGCSRREAYYLKAGKRRPSMRLLRKLLAERLRTAQKGPK